MRSKKELRKAKRRHMLRAWWALLTNNYEKYGIEIVAMINVEDEMKSTEA